MNRQEDEERPQPRRSRLALFDELGVAFSIMGRSEAEAYLAHRNYPVKLLAYLSLFDRIDGGPRSGAYVGLDFAHLVDLSDIDQHAREALLPMALDCEHFVRVMLASRYDDMAYEVGRDIVSEFTETLDKRKHSAIASQLFGANHEEASPSRRFQELLNALTFGPLASLVLFCGQRWSDKQLVCLHYSLRSALSLRNCAAHANHIVPWFRRENKATYELDAPLARAASRSSVSSRRRKRHLENLGVRRIATLIYLHARLVPPGHSRERALSELNRFYERALLNGPWYSDGHPMVSSARFLRDLTPSLWKVY